MCNSQRRDVLRVKTEHSSWESEGDSQDTHENDDSQYPVCEKFHDEFMMSRWHEPTMMVTRKSVLQDPYPQGPHNELARGVRHEDVASLVPRVQRRQGRPRKKAEETPLVPRTGQSKLRNWSRSAR